MGDFIAAPDYPGGLQYEWCAIDTGGRVGVFNTAGCGPVPSPRLDAGAAAEVLHALLALPPAGEVWVPDGIHPDGGFLDYARRGLFAFDWSDVGQPYTDSAGFYALQAAPVRPIVVGDLVAPPGVAGSLEVVRVATDFRTALAVRVPALADAAGGLIGWPRPG